MDQKLLQSLNNLSLALQEISDALKDKSESTSATAQALKSGDFIKEIKEINVGVKELQKDSKEILKNQQTIIELAKSKSDKKESVAEELGKDKTAQKNFKEGIGAILLIATAVLALGVAFNLIGDVNFLAVISLSIALPLLALAFSKVHTTLKTVGFDPKRDSVNFIIAVTSIALALTMSSFILSMITPLTFSKFFTVTFMALTFAMLGSSIYKFMMAFKDMSWGEVAKSVVAFPLILPAIALGLAFASWAFQLVKPIGFSQFLTAVGIGAVFAIVSFGIRKMLKSFDGLNPANLLEAVIFLPLILPAIALGISLSSYALQLVKPVGISQLFTAVIISAAFVVIAYGLNKMLSAFKGVTPEQAIMGAILMPILFVAISYAISYSSVAFSQIVPIQFNQFLTAVGIAAVFVVISAGLALMSKTISNLTLKNVILIPLVYTLISTAIYLSSLILSNVEIINNDILLSILKFSTIVAASVVIMGGAMWLLNKMGLGVKDAIVGGLLTVAISTALMLSSLILSVGDYSNYPDWKWSLGVGLSLIAFVPAIVALGLVAMSGIGVGVLLAGAASVLGVAGTISAVSHILATGKYEGGPPLWWSMSTALSLAAFTTGMILVGGMIVASFGLGAVALLAGSKAILTVADTIVEVSFRLQKGKYIGGPTKEWSEGIALALGAFSPVYGMLMKNNIMSFFGGGGVAPEDFTKAIKTVSQGIVDAAEFFSKNKSSFINPPPKEWAEGVGLAIGAFSPVYKVLADNSGLFTTGVSPEDMSKSIMTISQGIVDAAFFFNSEKNNGVFDITKVPSKEWAEGVGGALGAFAPVFEALSKKGFLTSGKSVIENLRKGIEQVSLGIVMSSKILSKGMFSVSIDPNFVEKISKNIVDYMGLVNKLKDFKTSSIDTLLNRDPVQNIAKGMVKIANAYDKLAQSIKNFSSSLNTLNPENVNSFTRLTGSIAMMSAMDSVMFGNMLKVLESRSGVFSKIIENQENRPLSSVTNVKQVSNLGTQKTLDLAKDKSGETQLQKLDKIVALLTLMNQNVGSIDEFLKNPKSENTDIGRGDG